MDLQNAATIIHAAYPDLPICDVYSATKNKDIVQSAFKFALKNTYTHDKIKTLCGFNLLTADVNFDATKINPFYKIKPHSYDEENHTIIDVTVTAGDYTFANEILSCIQPNEVIPQKITSLMNPNVSAKKIRKEIFKDMSTLSSEQKAKARIQKQNLDSFLTHLIRLTNAQQTFDTLFRDRLCGYFHLHHSQNFHKQESQTILGVCLKNNLPMTAQAIIDELNNNQKLIDSIQQPEIQSLFQEEQSKPQTKNILYPSSNELS